MEFHPYSNFDLLIEQVVPGYRARMQDSAVGEAWQPFVLPFTRAELSAGDR